ncbi:hypothetical protein BH160DRAFT_1043 [Burkholderia sp. H160]|nr:hypothetical protein BH160DRAFT_1043 [Burkholderia sp. H160]
MTRWIREYVPAYLPARCRAGGCAVRRALGGLIEALWRGRRSGQLRGNRWRYCGAEAGAAGTAGVAPAPVSPGSV